MPRPEAVALTILLLGTGCGLAFRRPTVRVADLRLTALSFTGGTVTVGLEIENPNGFPLEGEDFRYALSFSAGGAGEPEWLLLSDGTVPEPVRVPSRDKGRVDINLPFQFSTVGLALGSLLRQGELEYRFTGELRVRTRFGSSRIPFDERGVFRP
jgi:LEA14-like dessication related protein